MLAWCLLTAAVILARLKVQRQAVAPLFNLYLIMAVFCGVGLVAVGATTALTGHYPQFGALAAFVAILFNPLALISLFFAPMHLNRATLAFLIGWILFVLAGMYATAGGCPPWVMILEALVGLILAGGSAFSYFLLHKKPA
jgi:hypothetical protein